MASAPSDPSPWARRLSLAAVVASALAVGATLGLAGPLIALNLEAQGASNTLIGLNAAMPALAILLAGPMIPRLLADLGLAPVMLGGLTASVGVLLLFTTGNSWSVWFGLRFLLGLGMSLHWIASETWISRMASEAGRGGAVGAYATCWSLGIASGPQILILTGTAGFLPFAVAALLLGLAALPVLLARHRAPVLPAASRRHDHPLAAIRQAPGVFAAAFLCGFTEAIAFAFLPVHALRHAMDADAAVTLLSLFAIGGLVFQVPLGWLADRLPRSRLLQGTVLLTLLTVLAWPLVLASSWWLKGSVLLLFGGMAGGFYTLGLILLGQRFSGPDGTAANTAFVMAYTLGMLTGPLSGGAAFDLWPRFGLSGVLALLLLLFLVAGPSGYSAPSAATSRLKR